MALLLLNICNAVKGYTIKQLVQTEVSKLLFLGFKGFLYFYLLDFLEDDNCWLLSSFLFPLADFRGTEPVLSFPLLISKLLLLRLPPKEPRLLFKLAFRPWVFRPCFPRWLLSGIIMSLFSETWANAMSKSLSVRLLPTRISGSLSKVSYASSCENKKTKKDLTLWRTDLVQLQFCYYLPHLSFIVKVMILLHQ